MKRNIIIGVLILSVVIAGIYFFPQLSSVDVEVFKVKKSDISDFIEARGTIELNNKEKVYSKLAGTIVDLKVDQGDSVEMNSKLLTLEIQDINEALEKARVDYKLAKVSLDNLKKNIDSYNVKQLEAQVEQAMIAVQGAERDCASKKEKYEKYKELYQKGSISEQDLKDIQAVYNSAESTLADANQRLQISENNLKMQTDGVSKNTLNEAEAKLEKARLSVEELEQKKNRATVFSNIKGIILERYIDKGATVQQGTLLYDIGDLSSVYVKTDILVDDMSDIAVGQKAKITGAVLKDQEITGEVYYIAPKAFNKLSTLGVEQQRVEVRIKVDNNDVNGKVNFKPGYGVDVKIVTQEKKSAVYVPDKSIFEVDGHKNVFVVKNNKVELRDLSIGIENGYDVEVVSGVTENDYVVVDPSNDLKNGQRIKYKREN